MAGSVAIEPRHQPQLDKVAIRCDVNFIGPLKVEPLADNFQLVECGSQGLDGIAQFGCRPKSGTAAGQEPKAQIVLENLDPLARRGGSDTQQVRGTFQGAGAQRQVQRLQRFQVGRNGHVGTIKIFFMYSKEF
jgi:hypothetical protein